MPKIEHDFDNTPDDFVPTTPGEYEFTIDEAPLLGESKTSGNPMMTVKHVIATEGDFKGRTVINYMVLKNPINIKRLALCVGMSREDIADGFDTEELVGRSGRFVLRSESYKDNDGNDRQSSKIARYVIAGEDAEKDAE